MNYGNKSMSINYDSESGEYIAAWKLSVMGAGKTRVEALEDLRETALFGINTIIENIKQPLNKED